MIALPMNNTHKSRSKRGEGRVVEFFLQRGRGSNDRGSCLSRGGDDGGWGSREGTCSCSLDMWLGSLYIHATLSYLHLFTQFSRINVGTVEHHMLYLSFGQ